MAETAVGLGGRDGLGGGAGGPDRAGGTIRGWCTGDSCADNEGGCGLTPPVLIASPSTKRSPQLETGCMDWSIGGTGRALLRADTANRSSEVVALKGRGGARPLLVEFAGVGTGDGRVWLFERIAGAAASSRGRTNHVKRIGQQTGTPLSALNRV